ncbi:2669_t:CDS:2, partial [Racocetra fulgida]
VHNGQNLLSLVKSLGEFLTSEDSAIRAKECLSATPLFAKFAMPLLVEKLASDSSNAKKDSMVALKACAPVYGLSAIVPHLEVLWDYLKDEIINATNDSFELITLETIQSITETLSADEIESLDHLQQFLKNVVTECLENLKNSELKLAKPCGKILKYCAMTSGKYGILEILVELIAAVRYLYGSIENAPNTKEYLENIAHYKPKIVLDVTLPIFVSKLPNIGDVINKGSYTNYNKILDSISKISAEPILFEALVPEILAKLNNVLSRNDPTLGKQCAEGISIIIGENEILSRQGFAVVKVYILVIYDLNFNLDSSRTNDKL